MNKSVLIMAGGTGGHIYPALAVADYLKARGVTLYWLGSRHGLENRLVPAQGYPLFQISISGWRQRGIAHWLVAPFNLLVAVAQALRTIFALRPSLVLGMGGFVSGPGGIAARLTFRPLVIHEQNAIPGMTNRWLARIANRVLEAFPGSFPSAVGAVATGNPVREEISNLARREFTSQSKNHQLRSLRVLVFGGSRGAKALNQHLPAIIASFADQFSVWHQTGEDAHNETAARYLALKLEAKVEPYIDDMASAYAWSDLVISRAGALTIAELAAAGVASILIPFPHAVDDHQTINAKFLTQADAAILVSEKDLADGRLETILRSLLEDRERIRTMGLNARKLARPEAAALVGEQCLELINA